MTDSDNKDIFDLAIRLMEHDSRLTDDEVRLLETDAELRRIYSELQVCRNAVLRECDPTPPDVDREWKRFCRRADNHGCEPESKPKLLRWYPFRAVAAAAAVVALIVCGVMYLCPVADRSERVVSFVATNDINDVILRTGNGNTIALSESIDLSVPKDTCEKPAEKPAEQPMLAYESAEALTIIDTHTLTTPRGKDYKITLEDGTTVWLNAESTLQYPTRFDGPTRHVRLNGEAYFNVAKNPDRPFIITTEKMDVRVLGTELNVRTYSPHDSHVTLVNGSVSIADRKDRSNTITLVPGQDAQWVEGAPFGVNDVDTDIYVYWKDGYFYFDNRPLVDVMAELGRWYNFNVVFDNKELMDMQVRFFCVRGQSPDRTLDRLNSMKKIRATLTDNTVYIQ